MRVSTSRSQAKESTPARPQEAMKLISTAAVRPPTQLRQQGPRLLLPQRPPPLGVELLGLVLYAIKLMNEIQHRTHLLPRRIQCLKPIRPAMRQTRHLV